MFLYTPKKSILRDCQVAKTGYWWDKEWNRAGEILRQYHVDDSYNMKWLIRRNYKDVKFYSPVLVDYVPVNGYMFPAAMFDVEKQ